MRYFRPATLAEALAIRRGEDVAIIAGGTDIYPAYATRRAWGDPVHKDVLDISRLAELRGIEDRGDHIRIGALATWTDLVRADLPPLFDGLKDAGRQIGGLPGAEPRHGRRQCLHRLAGGRRHPEPARPRRRVRDRGPVAPAAGACGRLLHRLSRDRVRAAGHRDRLSWSRSARVAAAS